MKRKFYRAFIFVPLTILVCFFFGVCSKKSCKDEHAPKWKMTSWEIIRDFEYLQRTFYDLGYVGDYTAGDSLAEIRLFKSNLVINRNNGENPAPFGIAYVNPKDSLTSYPEGSYMRRFLEIDPNDYFVQRKQYWIQFFRALEQNDILAVFYVIQHSDSTFDTTGYIKDSCTTSEGDICMKLKLIKPDISKPYYYTWEYEWKNVYFMGAKNITQDSIRIQIYKGPFNAEYILADPNTQDGISYLRILGLDQQDIDGNSNPDGIVDYRQIDFDQGYLFFPNRHPFAPYPDISFTGNPGDTLKEKIFSIYHSERIEYRIEESKYYMYVERGLWLSSAR